MKKIVTLLFIVGFFGSAYAQNFNLSKDTIFIMGPKDDLELVGHAQIRNIQGDTNFTWKRIVNDLPANWQAAICDNIACWSTTTDRSSFVIKEGDSSILDGHFYMYNTSGNGIMQLEVWAGDDSLNADTITYIAGTWITNVKKVKTEKNIKIYPNPASNSLTLEFESNQPVAVEIYDVLGKKMGTFEHNGNSSKIDISSLPGGLYIIKVYDGGKTYTRTFKKSV